MLFDLQSGKRKRVVQVVYTVLAVMMGGSLMLLGIGSDAPGGLLDAVGLGSNDTDSGSNPQYEEQIENAQEKLDANPEDQQAMLALVRYFTLSATGSGGVERDPATGQTSITEDARSDLENAAQAWQDYLALKPDRVNAAAAASAVQAYQLLLDAGGAAEAQAAVAKSQGTGAAYAQLAFFYYADFQFDKGDAAAEKAVAASDPATRKATEKNLADLAERARKQKKLADKAAEQAQQGGQQPPGGAELTDPFGSLGTGSAGGTAPPVAPAP